MTTIPAVTGVAHFQSGNPSTTNTITVPTSGASGIVDGALMIAVYNLITSGGQTPVAPSRGSWTDLYSDSAVGTRGTVVKAHIRNAAADGGADYRFDLTANGEYALTLLWVNSWKGSLSDLILGTAFKRGGTGSVTNTLNSITTIDPNTLALALSTETTTAAESGSFLTGPTWPSGWTQLDYVPQGLVGSIIETIAVGSKGMAAAGATGAATITYQNTQPSNGWAAVIGIPPAPDAGPSTITVKRKDTDGTLHDSPIWVADGAGGRLPVKAVHPVGRGVGTPSALLAKSGFVMGHLGASWDEVEGSMEAITRALHWGVDGIMLSLQRTSDGKLFILNDVAYLDRMALGVADGTTLDPRTMTWATIAATYDQGSYWTQRATSAPRRPFLLLDDVLATYPTVGPIMIDPKTIPSTGYAAILDKMDANGGPTRFIAKYYITGTTWRDAAKARGYLTWGYGYVANMGVSEDWNTLAPGWDILGLDIGGASSGWTTALAFGKPIIGHIAKTRADYTTGIGKGAAGIMASGVQEVLQQL